jgi:hypothetical protein
MAMSELLQHADAEYFLSLMNGTKGTGLSRRPSVEVDGAPLRAQSRQYHTQGTRAVDTASAAHDTGHQAVTFQPAGIDANNLKTKRRNLSRTANYDQDNESVQRRSRLKSILLNKQRDNPTSETATFVTRGSSTASFFGNPLSKLKGYLSTYKHKKASQSSDHHELEPQSIPGTPSDAGGSYISGTRNPKYRQNVKLNNPQDANRNTGFSSY